MPINEQNIIWDDHIKKDQIRVDGTLKGKGFLGELPRHDGKVSTEISIGVNFDGEERLIPSLVPTLSKEEIDHLLKDGGPTEVIISKAVEHAKKRMAEGKSPFADEGYQKPSPLQEQAIVWDHDLKTETRAAPQIRQGMKEAWRTVENVGQVYPVLETAAHLFTNIYGLPASGIAGLGSLVFGLDKAKAVMDEVSDFLTYKPQTQRGRELTRTAVYPFAKLDEAGRKLGNIILKETNSPALASAAHTLVSALPALVGARYIPKKVMKGISESNLWRRATIRERSLVVQSLEETIKKNPKISEAELVKQSDQYFREAVERRAEPEVRAKFKDVVDIEKPSGIIAEDIPSNIDPYTGKPYSALKDTVSYAEMVAYENLANEAQRVALEKMQQDYTVEDHEAFLQAQRIARGMTEEVRALSSQAEAIEAGRINRQSMIDAGVGREEIAAITKKRPGLIAKDGAVHVDKFAQDQGYDYVDDLVQDWLSAPSLKDMEQRLSQELNAEYESYIDDARALEFHERFLDEEISAMSKTFAKKPHVMKDAKKTIREVTGQTKLKNIIEVDERQMLKDQIRIEAAAAREAYRAGRKEAALDAKVRQRVAVHKARIRKAERDEIRKMATDLKKIRIDKMPPQEKAAIESLLTQFNLVNLSKAKRLSLQATRKFFENNPDAELPERVLEQLTRLDRKNIATLDLDDIRDLHTAVMHHAHLARLKNTIKLRNKEKSFQKVLLQSFQEMKPAKDVGYDIISSQAGKPGRIANVGKLVKDTFGIRHDHYDLIIESLAGPNSVMDQVLYQGIKEGIVRQLKYKQDVYRKFQDNLGDFQELYGVSDIPKWMNEVVTVTAVGEHLLPVHKMADDLKALGGIKRDTLRYDEPMVDRLVKKLPGLIVKKGGIGLDEFMARWDYTDPDIMLNDLMEAPARPETKGSTFELTRGERMALYRHSLNPDNTKAILTGGLGFRSSKTPNKVFNITKEEFQELIDSMPESELAFAGRPVQNLFDAQYEALNGVFYEKNGYELPGVANYYPKEVMPLSRGSDFEKDSALENLKGSFTRIGLEKGMLKKRVKSKLPIYINSIAYDINKSVQRSAAYIGLELPLSNASRLLYHKDFRRELSDRYGEVVWQEIEKALRDIAGEHRSYTGVEQLIMKYKNNLTTAILGLNPFVMTKQILSFPLYLPYVKSQYLFQGMLDYISDPKGVKARHKKYSPEYLERVEGGFSRDVADVFKSGSEKRLLGGRGSIKEKVMGGIKLFDEGAVTPGMQGAVNQALAEFKTGILSREVEVALNIAAEDIANLSASDKMHLAYKFADYVTERTQPMFSPEHRCSLSRGSNVEQLFTMFGSFTNQALNLIRRTWREYRRAPSPATAGKLAKVLFLLMVVNTGGVMVIDAIRDWLYQRETKGSIPGKILENWSGYVFFLRDMVKSAVSKIEHGTFMGRDVQIPVAKGPDLLIDTLANGVDMFTEGNKRKQKKAAENFLDDSLELVLLTLGIPYQTPKKIVKSVIDRK